jgi:hypothetical protein
MAWITPRKSRRGKPDLVGWREGTGQKAYR